MMILKSLIFFLILSDIGRCDEPVHSSLTTSGKKSRKRTKSSDRYHTLMNTKIFLLPLSTSIVNVSSPWDRVQRPEKSYFAGFEPPSDILRWNQALLQANRGEQVLLSRVLRTIQSPFDLLEGDPYFKWVHRMADHFVGNKGDLAKLPLNAEDGRRAYVVMLGHTTFDRLELANPHFPSTTCRQRGIVFLHRQPFPTPSPFTIPSIHSLSLHSFCALYCMVVDVVKGGPRG